MATLGDPLTDIGWLELLWMQPVGIASHPDCAGHRRAARALHGGQRHHFAALATGIAPWPPYKMAVICLIGAMLYADGVSTDERYKLNA